MSEPEIADAIRDAVAERQGVIDADDERLRAAALRVWGEHRWGCDTAEMLADTIEDLREALTQERVRAQAIREAVAELEQAERYWRGVVSTRLCPVDHRQPYISHDCAEEIERGLRGLEPKYGNESRWTVGSLAALRGEAEAHRLSRGEHGARDYCAECVELWPCPTRLRMMAAMGIA
jgi:hypothetical protein